MKKFIASIFKAITGGNVQYTNGDISGKNAGFGIVGTGPSMTDTRKLGLFNRINVRGAVNVNVYMVKGSSGSVQVLAQENILPFVITSVRGDTLSIQTEGSFQTSKEVEVIIELPEVYAIDVSGSADVKLHNVVSKELELDVSGSADFSATGNVEKLDLDISGSVSMDLGKMCCAVLKADISGSAHVQTHVTGSLDLDISGAVSIVVTGKPKQKSVRTSGAADVIFM